MRKYSAAQVVGFILSFIIPPVGVWFTEGFGVDFWINVILCFFGYIPGSIHATYIWIVWVERKWQTHHGHEVTRHPPLIFSREFEQRSRWKGNGQDGFFGYFDDNIKGGYGANMVGGDVDLEQARPIPAHQTKAPAQPAPVHQTPAHGLATQQDPAYQAPAQPVSAQPVPAPPVQAYTAGAAQAGQGKF